MFSVGDRVQWYETEAGFVGSVTGISLGRDQVRVLWNDGLHAWQDSDTLLPYDPSEYEIDE